MVASQIQLREDMNLMVQQFQNMKSNQEENKVDHNPPTMESEKKINERMNKMEEMIRRARKMEDLMDYDSLSLFPNMRLPPVQDANLGQVWQDRLPEIPSEVVFEGYAAPRCN